MKTLPIVLALALAIAPTASCLDGGGSTPVPDEAEGPEDVPLDSPRDAPADQGLDTADPGVESGADVAAAEVPDVVCTPGSDVAACRTCAYEGCPPGACCDLVTGECADCVGECGACSYDFLCEAGLRCYRAPSDATGACVRECPDGACPAGFTCGWNADAIRVCTPDGGACVPAPAGGECAPCQGPEDCLPPAACTALGTGKGCLKPCDANADCRPGYVCYLTGDEGRRCLPISNNCKECAWKGCGSGKCCDLLTGDCEDCRLTCESCAHDFDCSAGSRCHKQAGDASGRCVPECPDGTCEDGFSCLANADGVAICAPETGCKLKPDGSRCAPCHADPCGLLDCTAVGPALVCLEPCAATSQCASGYVCYPTSASAKHCLPISNECKECAWKGCGTGRCCDLVTGECRTCKDTCDACVYDFECSPGSRCYKQDSAQTGVCVPECPQGLCDGGYACVENLQGFKLCTGAALDCP
jgi:hypothetical protein